MVGGVRKATCCLRASAALFCCLIVSSSSSEYLLLLGLPNVCCSQSGTSLLNLDARMNDLHVRACACADARVRVYGSRKKKKHSELFGFRRYA